MMRTGIAKIWGKEKNVVSLWGKGKNVVSLCCSPFPYSSLLVVGRLLLFLLLARF